MIRCPSLLRSVVLGIVLVMGGLTLLTGCEEESLLEPEATSDVFHRYVALGNSITAGFQSNGIVASTQEDSYAALLADQMNTQFALPRLRPPGCPPPVDNIYLASLNGVTPSCALRASPIATTLNNVAVPGAKVIDALSNSAPTASPNELTTFILGGRTQVEAATAVRPTFASVWLGNNDALGAALNGNVELLTEASTFESQITQVVDSLVTAGAERGVLVGVANPTFVPNLSPGQAYAAAEAQINQIGQSIASQDPNRTWGDYDVDGSCTGTGAATRIPFAYGFGTLFTQALQNQSVQLVCDPADAPETLLTPAEQTAIISRVQTFNSILSSLAQENGWVYVDVNSTFQALYQANSEDEDPANDLVPKFPNPPNLENPEESPPSFGAYFSEDGVHPSTAGHRVVTHLIIRQLNAQYETVSLEQVSIPDEVDSLLQSEETE